MDCIGGKGQKTCMCQLMGRICAKGRIHGVCVCVCVGRGGGILPTTSLEDEFCNWSKIEQKLQGENDIK